MQPWIERVQLRHVAAQPQLARLREPKGGDELSVAGVDTRSAVQLLDRLLEAPRCDAAQLSASDRDGLLAALHRALWGDRVVSSLECASCGAMYDLSFELSALQRQLMQQVEPVGVEAPRVLETKRGERFRLPSADDEEGAAQLGVAAGRAQLLASITREAHPDMAVSERLEALAPLIDVDLDTSCAECGHAALARFDIQSFVLQRLLDEHEGVLSEVHALASGYGWSLLDILSLPRSLRRSLVQRSTAGRAAFG
jgi:hypothetical protein